MFFILTLLLQSHLSFAVPATDASIHKLLEITNAAQIADSVWAQFENIRKQVRENVAKDHPPEPKMEAFLKEFDAAMTKFRHENLQFKNFEPDVTKVYRENYSEEEVT